MYTYTSALAERIYAYLRTIPAGHVVTYAQVGAAVGNPKLARAVGNILHKNPDPDTTPCFRVVNAKGYLAPAFAFGGVGAQRRRLEADGIEVTDDRVDLEKYQWREEISE